MSTPQRPPRDNLYRGFRAGVELRDDDETPTLHGHFAVFGQRTEIDSLFEGHFIEEIAPGAFKKTFAENRDQMRVLFQHGRDGQLGDKILGPIDQLREDDTGAYYEVPLYDGLAKEAPLLLDGLRDGKYGASFRFRVIREEFDKNPPKSADNPDRLPVRTIKEASVSEFGPVTFPAYEGATAAVRSLSDQFLAAQLEERGLTTEDLPGAEPAEEAPDESATTEESAPPEEGAEETHSAEGRRDETTEEDKVSATERREISEIVARQEEIKARLKEIYNEHGFDLDVDLKAEFRALEEESKTNEGLIKDDRYYRAVIDEAAKNGNVEVEPETRDTPIGEKRINFGKVDLPDDLHEPAAYMRFGSTAREVREKQVEGAKRIVERASFPHPKVNREDAQAHVEHLLDTIGKDIDPDTGVTFAERALMTTSALYKRAFGKKWAQQALSSEEWRALSTTTTAGGFAMPITIDPTVIPTSNGVVNPVRELADIRTIAGNEWRGVSSAGVSATYTAEVTEVADANPVFAQPTATVKKAHTLIPFSIEISQSWDSLATEVATMVADAKDQLEATKFVSGVGVTSHEPEGLNTGATAIISTAGATLLAVGDLYSLDEALPPRFQDRPSTAILANRKQFNRVRAFDTSGGSSLWVQLGDGLPRALLGVPNYVYSEMPSVITSGASAMIYGDFSHYLIVDKAGMNIELIPHLFATANNLPAGQRGYYCWWMNTAKVKAWQAFRTLKVT